VATPFRLKLHGLPVRTADPTVAAPLRFALLVAGLVAMIGAVARVAVPLPGTPVPLTLQDLAVLAVGVVLGPRRGAVAIASYVAAGALGAPVFSNGHGGLAWLMGPTGGYLLAYPFAAFVAGYAARPRRPWLAALAFVPAAQLVLFAGGTLQLALLTGRAPGDVVALAVVPFLPGALIKTAILVTLSAALAARRRDRSDAQEDHVS